MNILTSVISYLFSSHVKKRSSSSSKSKYTGSVVTAYPLASSASTSCTAGSSRADSCESFGDSAPLSSPFKSKFVEDFSVPEDSFPTLNPPRIRAGPVDVTFVRCLGSGTFGSVVLAQDNNQPGRLVAVKSIIKSEYMLEGFHIADDVYPLYCSQIKAERIALEKCAESYSPFLPQNVNFAQDARLCYFIMDPHPMSLDNLLNDHRDTSTPMPGPFLRWFIQQVVCAVLALHRRGIAHLDLKPANFMIKSDGYLCTIDFGLSTTSESLPRRVLGTTGYYAPEVVPVEGRPDLMFDTQTADVYSVGQVLLDLCLSPDDVVDFGAEGAMSRLQEVNGDMANVVRKTMLPWCERPGLKNLVYAPGMFENEIQYRTMKDGLLKAPWCPAPLSC
ncbi:kinase-like protein [Cylindrobasidium torrendii FP15055 ss-10]|uniref:non-specific serine/threonine protein kinase n=1 Tax=Cylindrobasidium torrendii FP15055 ss-10 TaxID=1314674 RepID=A0A0D7BBD4_9AGAR|nr:kinase-like protein [Cylindrobasidium torrendii FP15055 ss-10]